MKRALTLAMLGLFGAGMVGCSASADVDPDRGHTDATIRDDHSGYSKKETTVREPDGDMKKTTEVKRY